MRIQRGEWRAPPPPRDFRATVYRSNRRAEIDRGSSRVGAALPQCGWRGRFAGVASSLRKGMRGERAPASDSYGRKATPQDFRKVKEVAGLSCGPVTLVQLYKHGIQQESYLHSYCLLSRTLFAQIQNLHCRLLEVVNEDEGGMQEAEPPFACLSREGFFLFCIVSQKYLSFYGCNLVRMSAC